MKIIWITTQFPNSAESTQGIFIYRTVKELSNYFKISVICLYPNVPPVKEIIKNLFKWKKIVKAREKVFPTNPYKPDNLGNVNVHFVKYLRPPRGRLSFIEGWFAYFASRKVLKKELKPGTFIHANWLFPEGKMAELIHRFHKLPYVMTLRGSDVHLLKENTFNWKAAKTICNRAVKITSVSNMLLKEGEEKHILKSGKSCITHNFYETEKFIIKNRTACRDELGISATSKIIFYAGGLIELKNIDSLIKAVHELINLIPQTILYIAGHGREFEKLVKLTEVLGIQNSVHFVGVLNENELIAYYNAADVFCLPSKREGLPNVIIESLLCGTPVAASNIYEIPFIIKNGLNGNLFDPFSIPSLVEALQKGLTQNWDRNEIRNSISFLCKENIINEYIPVYKEAFESIKQN